MTVTVEQIQEWKRLADAATPGPWFQSCSPWQTDGRFVYEGSEDPHAAEIVCDCDPDQDIADLDLHERLVTNGAFIAAARTGWPEAVKEIERLKAEVERLEAQRSAGLLLRADIKCFNGCGCEEYDYCAADEWDNAVVRAALGEGRE